MDSQVVQQAVVVEKESMKVGQVFTRLALFNEDGTPKRLAARGDTSVDVVGQYAVPTDGVASSLTKLSDAFTANPSRRFVLRKGVYYLTTRLTTLTPGCVIEGEGPGLTIIDVAGAAFGTLPNDVTVRGVTFRGYSGATNKSLFQGSALANAKNWRFEDCVFDGVSPILSRIGATDSAGVAIAANTSVATGVEGYFEFDHCKFTRITLDGAFYNKGAHFVTVNRCHFADLGTSSSMGDNLKISYGAENCKVLHNIFERSTRDAIDWYDGGSGLIEGNTMIDCAVHAIEIKATGPTAANKVQKIRVIGNRAYNCQTFSSSAPSFQLSASHLQIEGNHVDKSGGYGFRTGKMLDGTTNVEDVTYTNNHATDCVSHGFIASGLTRGIFMANHSVRSTAGKGYDVASATNPSTIGGTTLNQSASNAVADTW